MNTNSKTRLQRMFSPVVQYFKGTFGILIGLLVLIVLLSFASDRFLSIDNFLNILRATTINATLAFGVSAALILGGVDLSVGSVVTTCGIFSVLLLNWGVPVFAAILGGILLGTCFGLVNGMIIANTGIHPFVVTLAMQMIVRGLAYIISGGVSVSTTDAAFSFIGNGYLGPIPFVIILLLIIMVIDSSILNRTRFGRRVYATGANRNAAIFSGINIKQIQIGVYAISGTMSALAGIILASRMYSGQPTAGVGYEGDAIAAAVLGGVSFSGGIGTIGGVLIGAILIGVLNNGMNLLQLSYNWQQVVKGLVIILAVYIDILKKRKGN